ncbi:MBOAT family protein [Pseudoflavitalea sp. G-6-1-2]|uniref:MBOAT family O-acyltransferase n=1 Tax=Pseudoflavitalea sp. G-6-1-2 TaxID=2728841 RepID=UPI00146C658D|nr:MBOAT family protein [Pseudoflavitalea sp. G-6-1-2]NML21727.1 MBOAT family protein [Pseudoflavitalea sp. G-6-1-2]
MLFNSLSFALFLPIVFFLYWFVCKHDRVKQNWLLLVSSYFFYACWDVRFLFLLMFSTALDYYSGLRIDGASSRSTKKTWLWISISINLGVLMLFKYFNFFAENFVSAAATLGIKMHAATINVLLPVGISFYTFHGLSYILDIYNNRIKAERNIVDYSVFVSFFPLLVAGPIERATHLLPQIKRNRTFNYTQLADGMRQILWGLVKKLLIADNLAMYADMIFAKHAQYHGSTLALGVVFFAIQIYADFSGYTDIATGTARLFGIELLRNFAFPYFSRDIAEFWRRWHISLTSWFKDYLYIPLGGSRGSTWMKIRNTYIVFLVSGFWHGANWTFIVWGLLHATYFLPLLLLNRNRQHLETVAAGRWLPSPKEFLSISVTFLLVCFAWIFFRSPNLSAAITFIGEMCSASFFSMPEVFPTLIVAIVLVFLIVEWMGREQPYAIAKTGLNLPRPVRWSMYLGITILIIIMSGKDQPFIYFRF